MGLLTIREHSVGCWRFIDCTWHKFRRRIRHGLNDSVIRFLGLLAFERVICTIELQLDELAVPMNTFKLRVGESACLSLNKEHPFGSSRFCS